MIMVTICCGKASKMLVVNIILFTSVFLGLYFLFSNEALAAIKYVNGSTSEYISESYPTPGSTWGAGDDTTGNGSISTPWATIEKALENSSLTRGDTLYVASGTYTDITPDQIIVAFGSGSGNTFIIGDGNPVFDLYSNPGQTWNFSLLTNVDGFVWDNIDITNSSSSQEYAFRIPSGGTFTFKNSLINFNKPGLNYSLFYLVGTNNTILNINSSILSGCKGSCFFADNTGLSSITISSSVIKDGDKLIQYNDPINTYIFNNTFEDFDPVALYFNYSGFVTSTIAQVANNIFVIDPDNMKPILRVSDQMEIYFVNNLSNWVFTNNVVTPDADSELVEMNYSNINEIVYGDQSSAGEGDLFYFENEKNWLIKTNFINPSNNNYTISDCDSTFSCGKGDSNYLPVLDIFGNTWSGNHIGAFSNPTTTQRILLLNSSTTAFIGDSILYGKWGGTSCPCSTGVSDDRGVWCWFDYYDGGCDSGMTVYAKTDSADLFDAMPSQRMQAIYWWMDAIILTHKPEIIFMAGGLNNFDEYDDAIRPGDTTLNQLALLAENAIKKAVYWGVVPTWLGIGATAENIMDDDVAIYNTNMKSICTTNGWTAYKTLAVMQAATSSWSSYFYDELDLGDVHPNTNGHKLMADIATIPTITSVSSNSNGVITWMTDEESSSVIDWGKTMSYEGGMLESDTSTMVLSHSVTVTNVYPCSTINYRIRSVDAVGNEGSQTGSFFSIGCGGSKKSSVTYYSYAQSQDVSIISTTTDIITTTSTLNILSSTLRSLQFKLISLLQQFVLILLSQK